jgi:hypothetical protein
MGEGETLSYVSVCDSYSVFPKALGSLRPTTCSCSANICTLHEHLSHQRPDFGKWGDLQCIILHLTVEVLDVVKPLSIKLNVQGTMCPVVPKCVNV